MEMNRKEELIEMIGETFLWTIVSEHVCTDVKKIKEELSVISYIEPDAVEKITSAEVLESDEFLIKKFSAKGGVLTVGFEMPAIIIAESDNGDVCFRITTTCTGTVEIPDIDSYDWRSMDFEKMNRYDILSHSDLAKIIAIFYEDTEVDDLTA